MAVRMHCNICCWCTCHKQVFIKHTLPSVQSNAFLRIKKNHRRPPSHTQSNTGCGTYKLQERNICSHFCWFARCYSAAAQMLWPLVLLLLCFLQQPWHATHARTLTHTQHLLHATQPHHSAAAAQPLSPAAQPTGTTTEPANKLTAPHNISNQPAQPM
jgi:hypothetical protein